MRSSFLMALLAALLIPAAALASDRTENQNCGATIHEAIDAADKSLAAKTPDQQQALACLLQAVKLLDAEQLIVKRGPDDHSVLHAPALPGGKPQ